MIPDRPSPHLVTVGLLDGATRAGRVVRFAPREPDLLLEVGGAEGRPTKIPVPAERISFVAFHRPALGGSKRCDRDRVVRKIHLPGGGSMLVEAGLPSYQQALGFYAVPHDPASPFEEIFFYAHGVNRVEDPELLGSMLVADGVLAPHDLERGLRTLSARRSVPVGQILLEQTSLDAASLDDALALQDRDSGKLGEISIQEGHARPAEIDAALDEQRRRAGARLGDVLVEMKAVSEKELAITLARKFSLPFVDLDERHINALALQQVDARLVARLRALPIDVDDHTLTVAICDPLATAATDQLRAVTRRQIREVVVTASQLHARLEQLLDEQVSKSLPGFDRILEELGGEQRTMELTNAARAVEVRENDSAVIKLANQIIMDAYAAGASDIHVEPNGRERTTTIRFRVDGDCIAHQEIPSAYRRPLVARLKIMAKLDISERRKPQDGKIRLIAQHKEIELRVATIPTVNDNEDVVLRVLAGSKPMPLDRIGLSERNLAALLRIIALPHGLILCVGPTGSGKTTTLHSILGALNTVDTKIWTVEDPVEITQPGLRQVQVNERTGVTFATALRAFLRADPDVIMVGEMRDEETARIAVEASLTGHVVFSTLHTNSAPETVNRLLDIGLEPFGFGDALLGVLAQRLVRGLCPSCRAPYEGSHLDREALACFYGEAELLARAGPGPGVTLYRATGCQACAGTGYKGRLALHELLVNDDATRALIQRRAPADEIRRAASAAGMKTIVQDGVEKALAGLIDLRQVTSVAARAAA
jgi:type II secretory ATPase GspE/PulE/Tfp pilus assembly ATPase PilB-like protein